MNVPRREIQQALINRDFFKANQIIEHAWNDLSPYEPEWSEVVKDALTSYSPQVLHTLLGKDLKIKHKWVEKLSLLQPVSSYVKSEAQTELDWNEQKITVGNKDFKETLRIAFGLYAPPETSKPLDFMSFYKLQRHHPDIALEFVNSGKASVLKKEKGLKELPVLAEDLMRMLPSQGLSAPSASHVKLLEAIFAYVDKPQSNHFIEAYGNYCFKNFIREKNLGVKSGQKSNVEFKQAYLKMKEAGISVRDIVQYYEKKTQLDFFASAAFLNVIEAGQDAFEFAGMTINKKTMEMVSKIYGSPPVPTVSALYAVMAAIQLNAPYPPQSNLSIRDQEFLLEKNSKNAYKSSVWQNMFKKLFEENLKAKKMIAVYEKQGLWSHMDAFKMHSFQESASEFFKNFTLKMRLDKDWIKKIEAQPDQEPENPAPKPKTLMMGGGRF